MIALLVLLHSIHTQDSFAFPGTSSFAIGGVPTQLHNDLQVTLGYVEEGKDSSELLLKSDCELLKLLSPLLSFSLVMMVCCI